MLGLILQLGFCPGDRLQLSSVNRYFLLQTPTVGSVVSYYGLIEISLCPEQNHFLLRLKEHALAPCYLLGFCEHKNMWVAATQHGLHFPD